MMYGVSMKKTKLNKKFQDFIIISNANLVWFVKNQSISFFPYNILFYSKAINTFHTVEK